MKTSITKESVKYSKKYSVLVFVRTKFYLYLTDKKTIMIFASRHTNEVAVE